MTDDDLTHTLTRALGDLAGTMTDDPHRLAGVRGRARRLRARRTAGRGAVAGGAVAMAAGLGVVVRPSGDGAEPRVLTTEPDGSTTTAPPVATTVVEPDPADVAGCGAIVLDDSMWIEEGVLARFDAVISATVVAADGDQVTLELGGGAPAGFPSPVTATLDQVDTGTVAVGDPVVVYFLQQDDGGPWSVAQVFVPDDACAG